MREADGRRAAGLVPGQNRQDADARIDGTHIWKSAEIIGNGPIEKAVAGVERYTREGPADSDFQIGVRGFAGRGSNETRSGRSSVPSPRRVRSAIR